MFTRGTISILLLFIASPLSAQEALLQRVSKVEKFYAEKASFSAHFEQTVTRAHLPDRPAKKSGNVYFKRPGKMRWDYEAPDKVYYVSDGKVLWNYVPESKLAYRLKVEDSDLFYALRFLWGEGSLAKDFELSDGGLDKDRHVILVKPREAQHNFKVLKLILSKDETLIEETELTDPADNISRLVFIKVSYQDLPDKGFEFTPPENVQVEDLSAMPTQ
jgi:outer membrane lipoprotein carrier protein